MTTINIDTGILLSAISVMVTIFMFIFKTQASKTEKSIIYSETIKKNSETLRMLSGMMTQIQNKLNANDVNIMELKKDVEYLKRENDVDKREISDLGRDVVDLRRYTDSLVNRYHKQPQPQPQSHRHNDDDEAEDP